MITCRECVVSQIQMFKLIPMDCQCGTSKSAKVPSQGLPYTWVAQQHRNRNVSTLTDATDYLLPYWLNYLGGDWPNRTQCLSPGSNLWLPTQAAFNGGLNDMWAVGVQSSLDPNLAQLTSLCWQTSSAPQAWGYYKREDIPFHYALADTFTVADHYHVS